MTRLRPVLAAIAIAAVATSGCAAGTGVAADAPPASRSPGSAAPVPYPDATPPPRAPTPTAEETAADGPSSDDLPRLGAAPALVGLDGWLQADGIDSLDDLRGQVVVVHFWTFGCINCKNTLPNLRDLYAEHEGDGLEVVGVHAPEFDYEKDPDAIAAAAADLGVSWPIALDTEHASFGAWQEGRRFWPRTYVVDQAGQIRFDRIGEGAYDELNTTVATLLADPPA